MPAESYAFVNDDDLTAKARIRAAALKLFAQRGEDAASMRAVATEAGVTVGLVVHHFGTKDQLRDAVEERIVEMFSAAIGSAPVVSDARQVARARDAAVADMLAANPAIVDYLRRALLASGAREGRTMVDRMAELAEAEVSSLREAGIAEQSSTLALQVTEVLMRHFGQLFLQPLMDQTFAHFDAPATGRLVVRIASDGEADRGGER